MAQPDGRQDMASVGGRDQPQLRVVKLNEKLDVDAVEIVGMKGQGHRLRSRFDRKAPEA
jgi:hypothetical protein